MTPVCGVVVTVALLAVSMTAVFGADDVCLLECRTKRGVQDSRGGAIGKCRKDGWRGGGLNEGRAERKRERIRNLHRVITVTVADRSLNWMLHMACNEIQH